jgi:predicted DNA-binding transcriptional regulator YafY
MSEKKQDQKTLKKCMLMIELLKKRGRLKAHELANELDLNNNRSIYYYKNILKTLGYEIKSIGGYQGGYELIAAEKLTKDELNYLRIKLSEDKELLRKIKKINEGIK